MAGSGLSIPSPVRGKAPCNPLPLSQLPKPIFTSRGSLDFALRNGAKTSKTGFLHLPDEVRCRIYQLAIYDHDRGAVFLPRKHPRKVEPDVDDVDIEYLDTDYQHGVDQPYTTSLFRVQSINPGGDTSAGLWVETEDLHEATHSLLDPSSTTLTDQQILEFLDREDDPDDSQSPVAKEDKSSASSDALALAYGMVGAGDDSETLDNARDSTDDEEDSDIENTNPCSCCGLIHRPATLAEAGNDGEDDGSSDSDDEDLSEGCASPDGCDDPNCNVCCDHRKHFEDHPNAAACNVFAMNDHADLEDDEHFDTEELVGMLYEPEEPPILLACHEVRSQCLPIYYSCNAFSWRFVWTEYHRSCHRFKSWVKSISEDHLKLVKKITFQGRHAIEEGLECSIDIDLIDESPFFETNVYGDLDEGIASVFYRDISEHLLLMAQSERSRPTLTHGHFLELANLFVQGMHRDPDGAVTGEGLSYRRILSPLF